MKASPTSAKVETVKIPESTKQKKAYYGIEGLPSIVDASLRAVGRYTEVSFLKELPIARLSFRYASETVRYGLSRMVKDRKEKVMHLKEMWITGLKKAIEITAGSAIIEPNLFDERFARIGAGFLNTVVRLLGRGGLVFAKFVNVENLNLEILPDEFIARTAARVIWADTENQPAKIGLLTLEQLFINQWLAKMPLKEYILPWLTKKESLIKPTS